MLAFYQRLASLLYPCRFILGLLILAAGVSFGYLLLLAPPALSQQWLLSSMLLLLLFALLFAAAKLFLKPLPVVSAEQSWRQRLSGRFKLAGFYLLALLLTALLIAILWLGLKAAAGIIRGL